MTTQKPQSAYNKLKSGTKDMITQIAKGVEQSKETKINQEEELDWEEQNDEDEVEHVSNKKGVVLEQGKIGTDKPKKLKDLFADDSQPKKKPAQYQQK